MGQRLMKVQKSDLDEIYETFNKYTMIPKERYLENLLCAQKLKEQPDFPDGSVVECGVWRGGMIAGFMEVFGSKRENLLFDSFEGLPPPSEYDGEDARWWHEHPEHPRYSITALLSRIR